MPKSRVVAEAKEKRADAASPAGRPASCSEELQQAVTCTICASIFSDPVTLTCGHSFCFKCLRSDMLQAPAPFKCYVCKQFTAAGTYNVSFSLRDAAAAFAECADCASPIAKLSSGGSERKKASTFTACAPPQNSQRHSRQNAAVPVPAPGQTQYTFDNFIRTVSCVALLLLLLVIIDAQLFQSGSPASSASPFQPSNPDAYEMYDRQRAAVYDVLKKGEGKSSSSSSSSDDDTPTTFLEGLFAFGDFLYKFGCVFIQIASVVTM